MKVTSHNQIIRRIAQIFGELLGDLRTAEAVAAATKDAVEAATTPLKATIASLQEQVRELDQRVEELEKEAEAVGRRTSEEDARTAVNDGRWSERGHRECAEVLSLHWPVSIF